MAKTKKTKIKKKLNNKEKYIKHNVLWSFILVIGLLPFFLLLITSIDAAFNGSSGFCFFECDPIYGFDAFMDNLQLMLFLFWPIFLVAVVAIIIAVVKLVKNSKNK